MAQVWLGILAGVILSDAAAHALAGKSVSFRVPTASGLAGIFLEERNVEACKRLWRSGLHQLTGQESTTYIHECIHT